MMNCLKGEHGWIRHHLDVIVQDIRKGLRQYFRMLSQFFRRVLGFTVRSDEGDYSLNECESQSTWSSTETIEAKSLIRTNVEINVDITCEDKGVSQSATSACPYTNNCSESSKRLSPKQSEGYPKINDADYNRIESDILSTNIVCESKLTKHGNGNIDKTCLDVNQTINPLADPNYFKIAVAEAKSTPAESSLKFPNDVNRNFEKRTTANKCAVQGVDVSSINVDVAGHQSTEVLDPSTIPLPAASNDSDQPWDWNTFLDNSTQQALQQYYCELSSESSEWDNSTCSSDFDSQESSHVSFSSDEYLEKSTEKKIRSTSEEDHPKCTSLSVRRALSQEDACKGNLSSRSPGKSTSRTKRVDSPCPKMLQPPPSEAMNRVMSDPPSLKQYSCPGNRFNQYHGRSKSQRRLWNTSDPKLTGLTSPTPLRPNTYNDVDAYVDDMSSLSPQHLEAPYNLPLPARPKRIRAQHFAFRPEIRTKDKYTYTHETYFSLCQCKVLSGRTGVFTQQYSDRRPPSDLVKTLRGWSRGVLVKPEEGVVVEPHFDLTCLCEDPSNVFLYEAPSAFERAAYRMDDHIVPEVCRRKDLDLEAEAKKKKKVKRRGVPNKHLQNKGNNKQYAAKCPTRLVEEKTEAEPKPEDKVEEVVPLEVKVKVETVPVAPEEEKKPEKSPQMDYRHFEGVPLAVVQKKKDEADDIAAQYAVNSKKKNKKNKNKKNARRDSTDKDCEEIQNILLGMGTDRGAERRRNARFT